MHTLEFQRQKGEEEAETTPGVIISKFPKYDEIHQFTDPRSSVKRKQDKRQEATTRTHRNQAAENRADGKALQAARLQRHVPYR